MCVLGGSCLCVCCGASILRRRRHPAASVKYSVVVLRLLLLLRRRQGRARRGEARRWSSQLHHRTKLCRRRRRRALHQCNDVSDIATTVTADWSLSHNALVPMQAWQEVTAAYCQVYGVIHFTSPACTPGSAPRPTLGNEYGKTLPFTYMLSADDPPSCGLPLTVQYSWNAPVYGIPLKSFSRSVRTLTSVGLEFRVW